MKDLSKFFKRRYSAISTKDELSGPELNQYQRRKSLNPTRSLNPSFNILDTFFNKRKNDNRTRSPKFVFLFLAGGILAIAAAIMVKIFHPYDLIFKWKLIFAENGEIFNIWEKPPVDINIKIYLFNITNAEAYMAGKEKMKFEEIGPYVYKELISHDEVVFNDNNTLSTRPRHPLEWQEHLSEGRQENDTVMMLNIALLSIAQVAADKSYFFRLPINILIRQTKSQPIVNMTVREFMFGYQSSITTIGNTFLSEWIYFDKVGLIDRMYDFDKDYETIYTGADDPSKSGQIATYMGSKDLPQWNHEHCSNIEMASDGTKFRSFIKPNETLKFFRKSMCRPQFLVRDGEETTVSGFNAYKYVFQPNSMDNGAIDERNKCYCKKGFCPPRGVIDVSDCYYGFPIFLSFPHFMDSDPKISENIIGMKPDPETHSSSFMIQPDSGLPLRLSVKLQINMIFRDLHTMANVEKFSYKTIPMVWFDINLAELPKPLKTRFNFYLNILPVVETFCFWIPLCFGILCLVFAIIRATLKLPNFITSKDQQINPKSQKSTSDKYSKVNLRSGVYNACEIKLFEMNEKCKAITDDNSDNDNNGQTKKLLIDKKPYKMMENLDGSSGSEEEIMICEIDSKGSSYKGTRRESKFLLENEPAISGDDGDSISNGSNGSNNSTLETDNGSLSDLEKRKLELDTESTNSNMVNDNNENTASGFGINNNRNSNLGDNNSWLLGETSSLIDDIGNSEFKQQLKIIENDSNDDQNVILNQQHKKSSTGAIKKNTKKYNQNRDKNV